MRDSEDIRKDTGWIVIGVTATIFVGVSFLMFLLMMVGEGDWGHVVVMGWVAFIVISGAIISFLRHTMRLSAQWAILAKKFETGASTQ